jgi:hypothetical protein
MDKISVCGTGAPGSTPGESTYNKTPKGVFVIGALAEQSGRLFVRSRKAFGVDSTERRIYPKGILFM